MVFLGDKKNLKANHLFQSNKFKSNTKNNAKSPISNSNGHVTLFSPCELRLKRFIKNTRIVSQVNYLSKKFPLQLFFLKCLRANFTKYCTARFFPNLGEHMISKEFMRIGC